MANSRRLRNWLRQAEHILLAALLILSCSATAFSVSGPLRVHSTNPRYFSDGSGKVVFLTGSHTWSNLLDMAPGNEPAPFAYVAYLDWMEHYRFNFMRLWTWELLNWDTQGNSPRHSNQILLTVEPHPWQRTGPGDAFDGKPRFNLHQFNSTYFERLRSRLKAAGSRDIYVAVMLFEGWGIRRSPGAWENHPFHPDNNVNGINGDSDRDGRGLDIHQLADLKVTRIQEAYVRKVIDTVNDLDNVLYEIINEGDDTTTAWQYHMIEFVREYERGKPKQHPIGMTCQRPAGSNEVLFASTADWISPDHDGGYRKNPPPADGRKVILSDTDHLWGIGGTQDWVWKTFLTGMNPIFMDPYDGVVLGKPFDPQWEPLRRAMGYARAFAERIDLAAMAPHKDLSSTNYCLAHPGHEYLIYFPLGGAATLDLSDLQREAWLEWFELNTGKTQAGANLPGGNSRTELRAPFEGPAVLHIKAGSRD